MGALLTAVANTFKVESSKAIVSLTLISLLPNETLVSASNPLPKKVSVVSIPGLKTEGDTESSLKSAFVNTMVSAELFPSIVALTVYEPGRSPFTNTLNILKSTA